MRKIIVDSRESRSNMTALLENLGITVEQQELEFGDYILAEGLAVERKTATDFILSIMDKRIMSQAPLLKQTYARPFIIVEGDLFNTRSGIEPAALMGAISWLTVLVGIQVIHTRDASHTAMLMATMQRQATEGLGYEVALRGGKPKDRSIQACYLVEGLPGIGATSARKLLEHFGSPSAVFNATPEDLRKCPGVGPKTIAAIHDVLHHGARLPAVPIASIAPPVGAT